MSGRPGTSFRCSRYPLIPAFERAERSLTSGKVFFARFDFIDRDTASELAFGGGPSSFCNRPHQSGISRQDKEHLPRLATPCTLCT